MYGDDKKRFFHEVENGVGVVRDKSDCIAGVKGLHRYFNRATTPVVVHITDKDGCDGILKEGIKQKRNEISFWSRVQSPVEVSNVITWYVDVPLTLTTVFCLAKRSTVW